MKWYKLKYGYFSDDFKFFQNQVYSYFDKEKKCFVTRPKQFYHCFKHENIVEDLQLTHQLLKEGSFGQIEIIDKDFEDFWETTQSQVRFKNEEVQNKVNGLILTFIPKTELGVGVEFWQPGDNYFFLTLTDKQYEKYVEKCKVEGIKPQPNKWQKIREYTQEDFDNNFKIHSHYQINYITKETRLKTN